MSHPVAGLTRRKLLGLMAGSVVVAGCQVEGARQNVTNSKVTLALESTVDILDLHDFRTDTAYTVTANVYEPLLQQTFAMQDGVLVGTDNLQGAAAESWEISPDGKRAVFHLRKDAKFASGRPITAKDFEYVFRRSLLGPGYITALLPFIGISKESQIQAPDPYTFVLTPSLKSPLFERFMTFQVFGAMDSQEVEQHTSGGDRWATEWLDNNVTPSGPYVVSQLARSTQVVLEPNRQYAGPLEPKNKGVTLRAVPDPDQRALLIQSGDLDVVDGLPPRLNAQLQNDDRVTVHRIPSSRMTYLGMNNQIAPFDNKLVRQAVSYAIPYQTILDDVMYGMATIAKGPVPPQMESFAGEEYWNYQTNLSKARALMRQSGVGPLNTQLVVQQSRPQDTEAAVFIQEALGQIGIKVAVQQLAEGAYLERLTAGQAPMFLHYWYSWGEDPFFQMMFLLQSESLTNYAKYSNPAFDAILEKGVFELDAGRRNSLSAQAQELVIDDAPWAFLYSGDYVIVTGSSVEGVTKPYDQHLRLSYLTKTA